MNYRNEKRFVYYSRIVMIIINSIEFIFNCVFIGVLGDVKDYLGDTFKERQILHGHHAGISASFSLFFISFFAFSLEFIAYCFWQNTLCNEYLDLILKKYNHLITLITFLICQFLYFIECLIIPVFNKRVNYFGDEPKQKQIKSKYSALSAVGIISLCLVLFLNFIVINLYKKLCFRMEYICDNTRMCCENCVKCFIDKLSCLFGKQEEEEEDINPEIHFDNHNDETIYRLTGEIRNLMSKNIELQINNI